MIAKFLPITNKEGSSIHPKLFILIAVFLGCLVSINTITPKICMYGPFVISIGSLLWPITFLMTDITNEVWGPKISYRLVWMGMLAQVFMLAVYWIAIISNGAPFWGNQEAFKTVFSAVPRITIASFISYGITQTWDVWLFNKLKIKTQGAHLWIRNNVGTITSECMDAMIFVTLAFAGSMPANSLFIMMGTTALLKSLLALADTPFCYALIYWARK